MRLGDVLKKERERTRLPVEEVAASLELPLEEYREIEAGTSAIEEWGPRLALFAIKLSTPTSRLISETGKSADAKKIAGQCGKLIKAQRERQRLSAQELASQLEVPTEVVVTVERGDSPIENYAPLLLRFSELVEQPIFNLFYPCGLPFTQLQDYP
jgi:transcriptional regulator with XRE-family HTH domain